ncbi:MAG: hypothetical protein IKT54_03705 [Clostridia bacterium]|nr:hypothetical protein [Clostridia bacterium]
MIPKWSRLDNAAKIYPSSSQNTNTQVFRFSCELYEDIDEKILQEALDDTITVFPAFQYVLKRGFFWYYLEDTKIKPIVKEEHKSPCRRIYKKGVRSLLYEVTYFQNTINFEVYHVLTDGTGALNFLRILVTKYLSKKHGIPEPHVAYDASHSQMTGDSFLKHYDDHGKSKREKRVNACKLTGAKYPENKLKVILAQMSVSALHDLAKDKGVSITVLLCACLLKAINDENGVGQRRRPVVLSVPVNLRNYFESSSARNFFYSITTSYKFDNLISPPLDDIIKKVNADFVEKINLETLTENLNSYCALENNIFIRLAPLVIKDIVLRGAYKKNHKKISAIFSNVGQFKMPEELCDKIRSAHFCAGTDRMQLSVVSFMDRLIISFSSPFVNSDIERRFLRTLTSLGLDVTVSSNVASEA